MKKRLVKSIIAAVLAVILAAVPVLSGFASAQSEICPVIDMRGFMNAKIYAVENDDTSEQLWPPTTDKILDLVKNIIGPLAKLSIDRNWDKFADVFAAEANKVFDGLFLDENGEVTIVGVGETIIKATVADSAKYTYNPNWASYKLIVSGEPSTIDRKPYENGDNPF